MEGARGVPGPRESVNNGHESARAPGHRGGRTHPRPLRAGGPQASIPSGPHTPLPTCPPMRPQIPLAPAGPRGSHGLLGPHRGTGDTDATGSAHRALPPPGSVFCPSDPREPPPRGHLHGGDTSPVGSEKRARGGSPSMLGAAAGESRSPGAPSVLPTPFLPIPPRPSHLGTCLGGSVTAAGAAAPGGSSGAGPRGREQRPRPGQARGAPGRTPGRFPIAAPLSRERPLPASSSPGKW